MRAHQKAAGGKGGPRARDSDARGEAIRARAREKLRKPDTRRKVLLGALVLHRIENDAKRGPGIRKWLRKELPGFIGERDRHLFDDLGIDWREGSADSSPDQPGTA